MAFPEERENGTGSAPYGMGNPPPWSGMGGAPQADGMRGAPPANGAGGAPQGGGFGGPPQGGGFGGAPRGGGFGGAPQGGGFGGAPQAPGTGGAPQEPAAPLEETAPTSRRSRSRSRKEGPAPRKEGPADEAEKAPQSRIGWSPYDEGPRSRAPLWFAIGGVLVLGLLGGGIAVMWNAGGPSTAETATARRTSAPLPSVPPGKYGFAESRTTDPEAITVKEIFGSKKKLTVSGRGYEMTITSKDKKCTDGALGDKLQKALKVGKCNQLVRASFRDKDGKVIGTVGVANLTTSKTAGKVAKSGDETNYVKPLSGKDSVTKFLGSGSGGAKIWTHGHYAIMVWFQNKDGTKPDKKGSKRLFQAIDDVTQATVFKALDNRTLTGSPLT
ncbi:hypothetical protein [Nonomuraea turcica]|uniref:hypothetical protein n=1 Tax=Nonomuraea sp. G32 TaxID=3067274 RepID=UPI00273CA08A|nr:hypothetical protein [Nonomuraea sp. G32]MDP4510869.1 hypothetical protein [Nonomuraea sp. G32]